MSKIDTLIKLAGKFKSDLRQQYKDSMSYPDAGETARRKDMGEKSPREKINEAFNYIERSKSPNQARNRAKEMFGEFDVDGAIEEAGGFEKAFKKVIKKFGKKAVKEAQEEPIPGFTQARQKMLTPAQKRRARKTERDLGPPSMRGMTKPKDVKDLKPPVEKAKGGMASAAKTITSKTTRSRNKTKPRGVGVALRGYGKALK
jgi:hypothetical protein